MLLTHPSSSVIHLWASLLPITHGFALINACVIVWIMAIACIFLPEGIYRFWHEIVTWQLYLLLSPSPRSLHVSLWHRLQGGNHSWEHHQEERMEVRASVSSVSVNSEQQPDISHTWCAMLCVQMHRTMSHSSLCVCVCVWQMLWARVIYS